MTDTVDLRAEGTTLVDGSPQGVNFVEGTANITVADGRLTLSPGPAASNLKICFVEISPLQSTYSMSADTTTLTEWPASTAAITLTSENGPVSSDTVIALGYSGSANPLADFNAPLPNSITIPAGQSSATFILTPARDSLPETEENLHISILPAGKVAAGTTASLAFTIADRPFDAWRAVRFTRQEIHSGLLTSPSADPGQTGQTLIMRYALGASPAFSVADDLSGMSVTRPTGGRTDVDYRIETSESLSAWTDETDAYQKSMIPVQGDPEMETLRFSRELPSVAPDKLFFRLRVDH